MGMEAGVAGIQDKLTASRDIWNKGFAMNPYDRPYFDPGQTNNTSTGSYSQRWGDEPASPAGDWAQRAGGMAYNASGLGDYTDALRWKRENPQAHYQDNPHVANMWEDYVPGPAALGAVRAVKEPMQGGMRTILQYYKDANPAKTLGELTYSKTSGAAPTFENIISNTPRGTGELLEGLQKRLGPMLNDMEITSIQPQAASFWQKLAGSSRLDNYPGLRERIMKGVAQTEQATPNSYNYNPYKAMGYFE